jgi:hypothetical protein
MVITAIQMAKMTSALDLFFLINSNKNKKIEMKIPARYSMGDGCFESAELHYDR